MAGNGVEDSGAIRRSNRADGLATVVAMGTANPSRCLDQSAFPDQYFKVTNSEHMTELKEKFKRMCDKLMINNRYTSVTDDILQKNPDFLKHKAPTLDARQEILVQEIPKLGKEAATKAIKEWGQPKSKITHLVFTSFAGVDAPGADFRLTIELGLNLSVKRYMIYNQGCYIGGMALRLAKDLAENSRGARVLVVCTEMMLCAFRGPFEGSMDNLLGQALFGDGAAAAIIGADPILGVEKPLFELVSASQTIIPNSADALRGYLREDGAMFTIQRNVPLLLYPYIEKILEDAINPLGISDLNSMFWIVHPGGPTILQMVEHVFKLKPEKLRASRKVLSEYGNMSGATVLFIMDEMRKLSAQDGLKTTGEGQEWGVLFGFGPGITVETLVLRSAPT